MKQVSIQLPVDVLEYIGNLLADRPYKESNRVIKMIAEQVEPQMREQPPAEARPSGAANVTPAALQ